MGGAVKTWTTFKEVHAQVQALSGREYWQSKQVNAETTHKINIRYLQGVLKTMRVIFGSQVLEIESVLPDERKTEVVMMCIDRGETV
jgi:SPP1 family predicted phage head-tail adaptor